MLGNSDLACKQKFTIEEDNQFGWDNGDKTCWKDLLELREMLQGLIQHFGHFPCEELENSDLDGERKKKSHLSVWLIISSCGNES